MVRLPALVRERYYVGHRWVEEGFGAEVDLGVIVLGPVCEV